MMAKQLLLILATMTSGAVHGLVANETTTTHVQSCDLECANGGYCTLVEGTEEELAHQAQSGILIEVCVCRPGFVGVACENVQEECTLPERKCHNNVPCRRTENGEWGCDCSLAESISDFAGRMCRKPFTEYCSGKFDPDAALSFCTNGGRCLADFIAAKIAPGDTSVNRKFQHAGCSCPPEFYGPHCEFLRLNSLEEPESNPREGRKVQSPATAIVMTVMIVSLLIVAVVAYRKRRRSNLPIMFGDSSVSTISNQTYIENSLDFSLEGHAGYTDDFTRWSSSSGSQLPTVMETVVLD